MNQSNFDRLRKILILHAHKVANKASDAIREDLDNEGFTVQVAKSRGSFNDNGEINISINGTKITETIEEGKTAQIFIQEYTDSLKEKDAILKKIN